jgi:hypothetical protein
MEACMAEQQVVAITGVDFGLSRTMTWVGTAMSFDTVPSNKRLEITTLTLAYYPKAGTVGSAEMYGQDSSLGPTVWKVQAYVEPKKTVHLPFPTPLRIEQGGSARINFVEDGPGMILLHANGRLVDA